MDTLKTKQATMTAVQATMTAMQATMTGLATRDEVVTLGQETKRNIAALRTELKGDVRQLGVFFEEHRDRLKAVCEGVVGLTERFDRFEGDCRNLAGRLMALEMARPALFGNLACEIRCGSNGTLPAATP
jgi:predicted nuclease with TOPRIM domain